MTTLFNFSPQPDQVFQFQPTLDGQGYTALVPYLLFGQRPYLTLLALNGALVFNRALVGTPPGAPLQSLSWQNGYALAQTAAPHGYTLARTVQLTVSGSAPAGYNGTFPCLVTGPDTFSYPLAAYPGAATMFGSASHDLNMAWGYFRQSTLVYRPSTGQFEVSP